MNKFSGTMFYGKLKQANLAAITDIADFIKNDICNRLISNETKRVDAYKNN